jgi:hypothetical protein
MKYCKLLLAVVGASVLLGALVSSASAGRISITNQSIRATFPRVDFRGVFTTSCEVTLEGSLHSRTFTKVRRLIGYITRAIVHQPCRNNEASILTETLPWHVEYESFEGTLPNITRISTHVIGSSFVVEEPFSTCLARSTRERAAFGDYTVGAGGVITRADIGGTVPTNCGFNGEFTGPSGSFTLLNSTAAITVRLI